LGLLTYLTAKESNDEAKEQGSPSQLHPIYLKTTSIKKLKQKAHYTQTNKNSFCQKYMHQISSGKIHLIIYEFIIKIIHETVENIL